MVRAFTCMGLLADLFGTAASMLADREQLGFAAWIGINILLVVLPMAYRVVEPALTAMTDASDVLRLDDAT